MQNPKFRAVNFQQIEKIVRDDLKTRYNLVYEADLSSDAGECIWWIRANQGHSMKVCLLLIRGSVVVSLTYPSLSH